MTILAQRLKAEAEASMREPMTSAGHLDWAPQLNASSASTTRPAADRQAAETTMLAAKSIASVDYAAHGLADVGIGIQLGARGDNVGRTLAVCTLAAFGVSERAPIVPMTCT